MLNCNELHVLAESPCSLDAPTYTTTWGSALVQVSPGWLARLTKGEVKEVVFGEVVGELVKICGRLVVCLPTSRRTDKATKLPAPNSAPELLTFVRQFYGRPLHVLLVGRARPWPRGSPGQRLRARRPTCPRIVCVGAARRFSAALNPGIRAPKPQTLGSKPYTLSRTV